MKRCGKLTKTVDNQVYDITSGQDNITYIPKGKKERLQFLKRFVLKETYDCWKHQPRELVTLKKVFLTELLDAVMES